MTEDASRRDVAQPRVLGPYSPSTAASGAILFLSGQVGKAPDSTEVSGTIGEQTARCIANLRAVLGAHGLDLTALVKCNVYLVDMRDFDSMNEAYTAALGDHRPARTTVGVAALPRQARVEIEAIASLG